VWDARERRKYGWGGLVLSSHDSNRGSYKRKYGVRIGKFFRGERGLVFPLAIYGEAV